MNSWGSILDKEVLLMQEDINQQMQYQIAISLIYKLKEDGLMSEYEVASAHHYFKARYNPKFYEAILE